MKHIQKDHKVKMYILREFANQNVVIVGEKNDEDRTSSSDRRKNRGSCHSISQCTDRHRARTHTQWWRRSSKILNLPQ